VRTLFNQARSVLRAAASGFRQGAGSHSLATAIIALSLTVLGAFGLLVTQLSALAEAWGRDLTVTAFLKADQPHDDVESLRQRAGRMPGAAGARFINQDAARERMRVALGPRSGLLVGLDDRIIPTAIEVELEPHATRVTSATLARALGEEPIVEEVAWGQEELSRLGAVVGILQLAALLLGGLIALVTVLVVSSTLKLTIMARRGEIEILRLVGAGDLYVRLPFILEGAAQGLVGAALAAGILAGLHRVASLRVQQVLAEAFGQVSMGDVPAGALGWLLVTGTLLGIVGGLVGVSRFLRS
jgi:cell division transport system permease protein